MREESEGYAKLATLLNQQAAGRLTEACTPAVVRAARVAGCLSAACMSSWVVLLPRSCDRQETSDAPDGAAVAGPDSGCSAQA